MNRLRKAFPLLALACLSGQALATPLPSHTLNNGTVRVVVTEAIGGRLLSFSLVGQPSFLRLDEAAGDPAAPVDAATGNVGWLGHEMWAGPQKQWWTHQDLDPARKAAKANWPPDPWLSLAKYRLDAASPTEIRLTGPASPVNGLQLAKRYALVPGKPNSLRLDVSATNRRATRVAWDIWFNTRVHAGTRVYVPVAATADVRIEPQLPPEGFAPPRKVLDAGLLSLELAAPGQPPRRGKVFVQPAAGWMAGFYGRQAFIVQFALQPRSAIHPDQGQVELYQEFHPGQPARGVLEMEVHAPYKRLAPGDRMDASERWTLLPYDGPDTPDAHAAFLRAHALELGLGGLQAREIDTIPAKAGAKQYPSATVAISSSTSAHQK
jgi:hypothetical protein